MKVNVAIVQAKSEYLNVSASIEKAIYYIEKEAKEGAQLITFGETWLTGYPTWLDHCPKVCLWDHEPTKEVFALLRENSPTICGNAIATLTRVAKENGIVVVMGFNERVEQGQGSGTLYNSLITIGTDGTILNHRRKLIPTFTERIIWGQGDGSGLEAVDTGFGRVGGLICWEHWMPLTRQAMHNTAEQIHIAVWPTVSEMHQLASRHYAFEGRCFVLASGLIESVQDLPSQFELSAELANDPDRLLQRGGSAIIGPDGKYIAGPVYDEETILTAEIDLKKIDAEKLTLDVTGHYYRDDVFLFDVKT